MMISEKSAISFEHMAKHMAHGHHCGQIIYFRFKIQYQINESKGIVFSRYLRCTPLRENGHGKNILAVNE